MSDRGPGATVRDGWIERRFVAVLTSDGDPSTVQKKRGSCGYGRPERFGWGGAWFPSAW